MDSDSSAKRPTIGIPMILFGVLNLGLAAYLFSSPITPTQPPSIYAPLSGLVSLCLGVAGGFVIRRQRRIALFNALAVICVLGGLSGMIYFGRQSFRWRELVETTEKHNVEAIVTAALEYAAEHATRWPATVDDLISSRHLTPEALRSPISAETQIESATRPGTIVYDYCYVGGGLTSPVKSADKILVAYSVSPRLGEDYICAFADGHSAWIKEVQSPGDSADDMSQIIAKSNTARREAGYPGVPITIGHMTIVDSPSTAPEKK